MLQDSVRAKYQPVIGLEVHIQLHAQSKIFATDGFAFGSPPNHHLSAITLAHPGALPSINKVAIHHAIKLGLAMGCKISPYTFFDRKNYFYPDLPKGYQISQDRIPICIGGALTLNLGTTEKTIRLDHIHLEEDAGKSIHDGNPQFTQVDLNRAGSGLLEMVTQPDLRSNEEACLFVSEIRKLARYLEISEGDMEKGHIRCDANVSVMKKEASTYGTRVEIKNLNSITFMGKAIAYEIDRQIQALEAGESINQQTRTWVADKGLTVPMRDKETADDYRYFPEPDLLPVRITQEELDRIQASLPELPQSRFQRYTQSWDIQPNEALAISEQRDFSDYFESVCQACSNPKAAASWVLGPVKTYLNEHSCEIADFPLTHMKMGELIQLIEKKKITHDAAKKFVFPAMLKSPLEAPGILAQNLDVLIDDSSSGVEEFIDTLLDQHPDEVRRFRGGKKGLMGFFVGKVMQAHKGKVDPKVVNKILSDKLKG